MKVVQVTRFGGPDVLELGEMPDPVPGAGQVVVGVAYAEINFVETQLRRGITPGPPLPDPPYVPGGGVAGEVVATGDGVDAAWLGRPVVTRTAGDLGGDAERAVAAAADLHPVPDGLGLDAAAALLNDGATAIGLAAGAAIEPGEWVLVEAAAGGLGSLLVQLARSAGAHVVGAARGERKLALIRELGADAAVDYSAGDWAARVREITGGRGVDVAFDGVGGAIGRAAFGAVARGGRFSVHGASSGAVTDVAGAEAERAGVRVIGLEQLRDVGEHAHEHAERALAAAARGDLAPVIGRTSPLAGAAEAHAAIEARAVAGKSLLKV